MKEMIKTNMRCNSNLFVLQENATPLAIFRAKKTMSVKPNVIVLLDAVCPDETKSTFTKKRTKLH